MKKALTTGLLLASASLSTQAEVSPFIGASIHSVTLSGSDVRPKSRFDKGGPTSYTSSAAGFIGGLYISDSTRFIMQSFSEDLGTDIVINTTVTTFGVDYVFGEKAHSGFFTGLSFALVELSNQAYPDYALRGQGNETKGSGLGFRLGYTHKLESNIMIELGANLRSSQIEHKFQGSNPNKQKTLDKTLAGQGDYTVKDFHLSVGYIF